MRINHNIAALNTYRQLGNANQANSDSMQKLSSGLRINNASDDAAGLAISEKMRGQIRGLEQAQSNAQDGISMIQTAEGALNETHSILQRMRELSVQSANDTATEDDRMKIQSEVDELAKEVTRISNNSEFNTQNLLAGGLKNTFQIGANEGQSIEFSLNAMDANTLGISRDANVSSMDSNSYGLSSTSLDSTSSIPTGAGKVTATDVSSDTSASVAGTAQATDFSAAGSLELKIDGTNVVVALDGNEADAAAVATKINAAANTELGTTGQTYANQTTGTFTLSSVTSGSSSSIEVLASSDDSVTTNLKLTEGSKDVGEDAGTIDVTFTDSASNATTVNVKANASNIDFGNGLEVTKDVSANSASLLANGSTGVGVTIQSDSSYAATLNSDGSVSSEAYVAGGISVLSQDDASSAISRIDDAIKTVSEERSKMGAIQNRLDHTINNLGTSSENLTAAESRIRDVDMAKEMMNQTKSSILAQASQAMLAKANQQPQGVLQLLR
ncbi:flagellin N-terminal helical domain-containing protein [Halobacillus sp. K22]|uniref:flagellin N-terminal helical domain-containing protein n=1 Tax=Halobacillus sp. K22 TaxID=3457431 RepID=UPI003FCC86CD